MFWISVKKIEKKNVLNDCCFLTLPGLCQAYLVIKGIKGTYGNIYVVCGSSHVDLQGFLPSSCID